MPQQQQFMKLDHPVFTGLVIVVLKSVAAMLMMRRRFGYGELVLYKKSGHFSWIIRRLA